MKKEYIKTLIICNFYQFKMYKITDAKGQVFFNAEPVCAGVTRTSETEAGLVVQLVEDCKFMNMLNKKEKSRWR